MKWILWSLRFVIMVLMTNYTFAAADASHTDKPVPDFLQPWSDWIKSQNPQWSCSDAKHCVWPGYLQLNITDKQAEFTYWFSLQRDGKIRLPGSEQYWPLIATAYGAVTASQQGFPEMTLQAGIYKISGILPWDTIPELIPVDPEVAYVDISLSGSKSQSNLQEKHNLQEKFTWHRNNAGIALIPKTEKNRPRNALDLQVYRHLSQGYPQYLETQVRVKVSGESRQIELPPFDYPDTQPIAFESELPYQIKGKQLLVQVKQGIYWIRQRARFVDVVTDFPAAGQRIEYWSISRDQPVQITGQEVDPQQVEVPHEWQNLPAYKLDVENALAIELLPNTRQGQNESLSLERQIWLDFAGQTLAASDHIQGQVAGQWRLNLDEAGSLQRVSQNAQSLLITHNNEQERLDGVEIRDSKLNLSAISLWPLVREMPKTGWNLHFDRVDTRLNLPPGWRLLATAGDGHTSSAWLNKWTLWSVFVLLFASYLSYVLMGTAGAIVAGGFMLLVYQSNPEICGLWITLVLVASLFMKLHGKLKVTAGVIAGVFGLLFCGQLIQLSISDVRQMIYPQLEYPSQFDPLASSKPEMEPVAAPAPRASSAKMALSSLVKADVVRESAPMSYAQQVERYGEEDFIQTGVGLPEWRWHSYQLLRNKSVAPDEKVHLYLLSPWMTKLWLAAGLLCLYLAVWFLIRALRSEVRDVLHHWRMTSITKHSGPFVLACVVMGMSLFPVSPVQAAETTAITNEQLQALEDYLAPVACETSCASFTQTSLSIQGQILSLNMQIEASERTQVRLPYAQDGQEWQPSQVLLDQKEAKPQLRRSPQGAVFLSVPKGRHQLQLSGALKDDRVELIIPQDLYNVTENIQGWQSSLRGSLLQSKLILEKQPQLLDISETLPSGQLMTGQTNAAISSKASGQFPAFVEVQRTLNLGVKWTLTTQIRRISPEQGSINLEIPLLPGEKPLSGLKMTDDEMAQVELGPDEYWLSWESAIDPVSSMSLEAASGQRYYEIWTLNPGLQWSLDYSGLEPVSDTSDPAFTWKPKPKDQLELRFYRPEAKEALSQSVESVNYTVTQGEKQDTHELKIHLLASKAGDYALDIIEDADIKKVLLNQQPVYGIEKNHINVPLTAGKHELQVLWSSQHQQSMQQSIETFSSSLPLINISMSMKPPAGTWLLHVYGPDLGPAVLYWGVLFVVILGACIFIAISRRLPFETPAQKSDWILFGIGTSTLVSYSLLPFALWVFALGGWTWFMKRQQPISKHTYQAGRVVIVGGSIFIGLMMISLIPVGLLANPDMQIIGNKSYAGHLQWFVDYLPTGMSQAAGYFAVPQWVYSAVMLVWSLWLATRMVKWFFMVIEVAQVTPIFKSPAASQSDLSEKKE